MRADATSTRGDGGDVYAEEDRLRLEKETESSAVDAARSELDLAERRAERDLAAARATGHGVDAAKAALAEVQERRAVLIARRDAAADKLATHLLASRENEEAEELAAQQGCGATEAELIPELDAAFRVVEAVVAKAGIALVAREKAWPERPVIIAKNGPNNIMGTGRRGWDGRKAVLLGGGDPHVSVGLLFSLYRNDPRAPYGGPVQHWRGMAEEAGLLPMTEETKARLDADKRQRADALVQNSLADHWTRQRLASVWGAVEKRDVGMDRRK